MKSVHKFFFIIPRMKTGGPHSMHQFAASLQRLGFSSNIMYYNSDNTECIYEQYKDQVNIVTEIDDVPENVLIVPEIRTNFLENYHNVKKVIWWLSLNYFDYYTLEKQYERWTEKKHIPASFPFVKAIYSLGKKFKHGYYNKPMSWIAKQNYYHLYNCEYAHRYLINNNIPDEHTHYLCGPIDYSYFSLSYNDVKEKKENYIAYNPKKVDSSIIEAVQAHINSIDSSIRFVRIENMSLNQVMDTLIGAKVYLDLGSFPGPERIPREAVSLYCNIITSRNGAAANDVDIAIPDYYKFDVQNVIDYKAIAACVMKLILEYEEHVEEFDTYRKKVRCQLDNFDQYVSKIADMMEIDV